MERSKKSTLGILVLALFVIMGLAAVNPQPAMAAWETVIGKAPLGADEAAAEQQAINTALRSAVEKQAGAMIQANTQIRNGQVVMDNIMADSGGYIKSYNVLSSAPSSDGRFYIVTLECDVLVDSIRSKIASMEQTMDNYQRNMQRKNVIVLGLREFRQDMRWASKPFTLAVQMANDKLRQAKFVVLDESAVAGYKAVIDTLKTGQLNRAGLMDVARAANADYVVLVAMDATYKPRDASNAFNVMGVNMRVDLLDVNTGAYETGKYEKGTANLNQPNPTRADLREACTDLARQVAEPAITDTVYGLMQTTDSVPNLAGSSSGAASGGAVASSGTAGGSGGYLTQRYLVIFERFQDQHVDSILSDLDQLQGVQEAQVQQQTQRLTRVQVFYNGRSNTLRTHIKEILQRHGYGQFRVNFSGNKLVFKNTLRF
jgi:hypothetical protein